METMKQTSLGQILLGRWHRSWLGRHFADASLFTKLMLAFLTVVLVSIGTGLLFTDRVLRQQLTTDVGETLQNLASVKAQSTGDFLAKEVDTLQALSINQSLQLSLQARSVNYQARNPAGLENHLSNLEAQWRTAADDDPLVRDILQNALADDLLNFRNKFPEHSQIILTDHVGGLVAATNRPAAYRFDADSWWQAAYRDGRGGIYLGRSESDLSQFFIAVPIYGTQPPVVVGVLRSTLSLDVFRSFLSPDSSNSPLNLALYLPPGSLFRLGEDGSSQLSEAPAVFEQVLADLQSDLGNQLYRQSEYQSEAYFFSQAPVAAADPGSQVSIQTLNWHIVSYQSRQSALQVINTARQTTLFAGLLALVLAGGLAFGIARLLTKPIFALTEAVARVAEGDLTVHAPVYAADEVGTLASTFNMMTEHLSATMDKLTQRTGQVQRANNQLKASSQVAQKVTSILELDSLLDKVVELIRHRFGYYFVGVWFVERQAQQLTLQAFSGEAAHKVLQPGFKISLSDSQTTATATAVKTGEYQLIEKLQLQTNDPSQSSLPRTRSHLAVPLHLGERVVGVLDIRSDRAEAFDAEDLRVVQTLANQIAIAINNARLYGKLSTLNETLEQRVQDRTAELNEAYRTLERLDQAKVDFISVTSHELRTPLTIISGYTQLLQSLNGSASPGDKEDLLKGIMSGTTRMQEIVNTMLDVSKIDSSVLRVHPETVVLGVVINLVAEKLSAAVAERNITLTIGSLSHLPTIQADPDLLHKLFHQLLINAIKYTPDGGQISIEAQHISYEQGHDVVEVMLADTGVGIDAEHLELIFEKFYQMGEVALHSSGKTKYKGGGPGLGLAIAKGIVVAHQGRIWAESPGHDETACPGSQFYVQLPLHQSKPD